MKFYTDFSCKKGNIYYRGYDNGKRVKKIAKYKPYVFVKSDIISKYKTLNGEYTSKIEFDNVREAKNFIFEKKEKIKFWGIDFDTAFIHDEFPGKIEFDYDLISKVVLDIETSNVGGYPDIEKADKEITAITLRKNNKNISFGCKEYKNNDDNEYILCDDEKDLLEKFLDVWESSEWMPEILSGWNIDGFDLPYLAGRITRLFNKECAEKLSPWGILDNKTIFTFGKERTLYFPAGIQVLDYQQIYKKFSQKKLESYSLEFVCQTELGEGKLDYSEYQSLDELYEKDYEKFIDYNRLDCKRIDDLEDKLGMMRQLLTIAYLTKTNYSDVFGTIKMWDSLCYEYLKNKNIVVPNKEKNESRDFEGGYVKEVTPGKYEWVVSFDFTSLYPSLIMSYNISPETLMGQLEIMTPKEIIDGGFNKYKDELIKQDLAIAGNSCLYERKKQGMLPILMEDMFNKRVKYKNEMKEKKKLNDETLKDEIQKLSNFEQALKILLNSGFGAVSNQWFRFFDIKNAQAITLSGQMAIQWVERYINEYMNKIMGTKDDDFIIGMDTDSIYINFGPLINKLKINNKPKDQILDAIDKFCGDNIQNIIDKACNDLKEYTNAFSQKLFMKREIIADYGLWRAKKNYILNVLDDEGLRLKELKLKIMGIEIIKSNTPKICRDALRKSINIILMGTEKELLDYVNDFKKEYNNFSFIDIASPTGIHGILKYKMDNKDNYIIRTPRHVKGAIVYNEMIKKYKLEGRYPYIYDGDKIKFLTLKCPNPAGDDVISILNYLPSEFGLEKYIDYPAQFKKTFIEPLKSFTDIVGWQCEKKSTISGFFA